MARSGANDVFAAPIYGITADVFGRIYGQYCVIASNIAKYDAWHGLVICDEFHPLRFNCDQLCDYFDVALRWLDAAQAADPLAQYPYNYLELPLEGGSLNYSWSPADDIGARDAIWSLSLCAGALS